MRTRIYISSFAALFALVGVAHAADVYGDSLPWERGSEGTTYQHWLLDNELPDSASGVVPDQAYNPYGSPDASFAGPYFWGQFECGTDLDPTGVVGGMEAKYGDFTVLLNLPNSPEQNAEKKVIIQITATHALKDVTVSTIGGPAPEYGWQTWDPGFAPVQWENGWYTYTYGVIITPNPAFEQIALWTYDGTVIDQIVVDTICVPEPASLGLLGLAFVGLIRRR